MLVKIEKLKKYYEVIKKYSINNKFSVEIDKEYEYPYILIEVETLDFLPKLEDELSIYGDVQGLIFSTLEDNLYRILIYDSWIE